MGPFKFREGQMVVVVDGVFYGVVAVGGLKGAVASVWPKAGSLSANQYSIYAEWPNPVGAGHLVFDETQLKPAILEELASL